MEVGTPAVSHVRSGAPPLFSPREVPENSPKSSLSCVVTREEGEEEGRRGKKAVTDARGRRRKVERSFIGGLAAPKHGGGRTRGRS